MTCGQPGPVTVITGAGSGLGRALAGALAGAPGAALVLVGRREHALAGTREGCLARGLAPDHCLAVPADVTDPAAVRRVVEATVAAFGRLDALVNNAGLARFAPLEEAAGADLWAMVQTNLAAPAELTRCALPHLRERRGCVVNIGSIGGLLALPGRALYGATKAALAHLTRSLARELAPEVRVNAVLPGALDTPMHTAVGLDAEATERLRRDLVRTTPLGRMGRPEDVVPWVELLLSPAGEWMTGSLIVVDGGRSC